MSDLREKFEGEFSKSPFEFEMGRYPDDSAKYAWPGSYRNYKTLCAWEGFQLGYKAGIEAAAKVCDEYPQRDPAEDGNGYWAANNCADAIRQLGGE